MISGKDSFQTVHFNNVDHLNTMYVYIQCLNLLNIFWDPKKAENSPSECSFELWHRAQTLHCGIHVTGVAQVCQPTRQLHLKQL